MPDFEIIEYDQSYAGALADMWNKSGDSWGGYNVEFTAESVRQEEEASTAEARYMAVIGGEVVGFVNLLKWTQGEGALYVGVLNVRPDYHGRKIGKALLMRTIERTTELGWNRLDLHTWGGNTKAVPLYKRTGFFWEERDREVYCVNFIPGILRNELVADFFEEADWYRDSDRPIAIEPDGRKENEFTYFTYSWKKDDRFLTMEYARKGRGLSGIDRNEYSVTARVENLNVIFGRSYTVRYEFENRGDQPMEIAIAGRDDKNIRFAFSHAATVTDTYSVEAEFYVGEIDRPQSEWKTHPRVSADITINGKTAAFEVGVAPQFPAVLSVQWAGAHPVRGRPTELFVDIESKLSEAAELSIALPESPLCELEPSTVTASLQAKERTSLPVRVTPRTHGVYAPRVPCTARLRSGEELSFGVDVGLRIPLFGGSYHGEIPDGPRSRVYTIGNGPYALSVAVERDSHQNVAWLANERNRHSRILFFPPKLGKPFTEEFMQRRPDHIDVDEDDGEIRLSLGFESSDFPGVLFRMCFALAPTGLCERWFEVENTASERVHANLAVFDEFRCETPRIVLPYRGGIVETESETDAGVLSWTSEHFTENWLFSRYPTGTAGLIWRHGLRPQTMEWTLSFEHAIGALESGATVRTPALTAFVDTFATWSELREYATGSIAPAPAAGPSIALDVGDGNPFADGPTTVTEYKQKYLDGEIELSGTTFRPQTVQVSKEEKRKSVGFELPVPSAPVEVLTASIRGRVVRTSRSAVRFAQGDSAIETRKEQVDGFEIFEVHSGAITFRVAPAYSPGLLTCRHDGVEWLDTTFPDRGPRDWWNPWLGGSIFRPSAVGDNALIKERSTAAFEERRDGHGNLWQGVRVTTTIAEHEEMRGLEYDQYFLVLPGAPVLLQQAEIRQGTGTHFAKKGFHTELFVGSDPTIDTSFSFRNTSRRRVEIVSGHEEKFDAPDGAVTVRRAGASTSMIAYADFQRCRPQTVTNKRTSSVVFREQITARDGETVWSAPKFLVFADFVIEDESLRVLGEVRLQ